MEWRLSRGSLYPFHSPPLRSPSFDDPWFSLLLHGRCRGEGCGRLFLWNRLHGFLQDGLSTHGFRGLFLRWLISTDKTFTSNTHFRTGHTSHLPRLRTSHNNRHVTQNKHLSAKDHLEHSVSEDVNGDQPGPPSVYPIPVFGLRSYWVTKTQLPWRGFWDSDTQNPFQYKHVHLTKKKGTPRKSSSATDKTGVV